MDISTLNEIIDILTEVLKRAQERYNLHPSDQYIEGKVNGAFEALKKVENMLQEEIDFREYTDA